MKYIIVLLSLFLFAACHTSQPAVKEVPLQYKETIVERLVPVVSPADSANIAALFECDSLNNVIMKSFNEQKSKHVESKFSFNNGLLNYNLLTAPDTIYIKGTDITITKDVPVYINVPGPVTNILTWWQKLWITVGKCAGALGLIILVIYIIKSKFSLSGLTGLFR